MRSGSRLCVISGRSLSGGSKASTNHVLVPKNVSLVPHLPTDGVTTLQTLAVVVSGILGIAALLEDTPVVADRVCDQSINLLLQWIG